MKAKIGVINSRPMEGNSVDTASVKQIVGWYQNGSLNLCPEFQRKSVWNLSQRAKLLNTILRQFPIPAVVLYKRRDEKTGRYIYDAIDGKQRLETILLYLGLMHGEDKNFVARFSDFKDGDENIVRCRWKELSEDNQKQILDYLLPVIWVGSEDGISDVYEVFVRLNSTGKSLTAQEIRKAKYFHSELLKQATAFARKMDGKLLSMRVLSSRDIERMRDVEFLTEMIVTVLSDKVLDKKRAIDLALKPNAYGKRDIDKAIGRVKFAVDYISKMIPNIAETRLHKAADFYTLVRVFDCLREEGAALQDGKSMHLAGSLLTNFALLADKAYNSVKNFDRSTELDAQALSYVQSVREGGDAASHRREREKLIRDLLNGVFTVKDNQRIFNELQRRIIWNSTKDHRCCNPECRKQLKWPDFEVDHIKPHSKGGRTDLSNAALICKHCNASKGNREIPKQQGAKKQRKSNAPKRADGRKVVGVPYKVSDVVCACFPIVFDPKMPRIKKSEVDFLLSKESSAQFRTGGWAVLRRNNGRKSDRFFMGPNGRKYPRYYAEDRVSLKFRGKKYLLTSQFGPTALTRVVGWLTEKGVSKKQICELVR